MIVDIINEIFKKDPTIKRHIAKSISWRIVSSFDTVILGWYFTGKWSVGGLLGVFEIITKIILYFFHERVWHKLKFGKASRSLIAANVKKQLNHQLFEQKFSVTSAMREKHQNHKVFTIWLTGLSASGKSTIASNLDNIFFNKDIKAFVLDGDNTRLGINSDLNFSDEDRKENIRRVAEICKLFNNSGTIAIASFISPFVSDREMAKSIIGADKFIEIYIDANIETCKQRDRKGLYALAEKGKIKNFTGISSPYETPLHPMIHLKTDVLEIEDSVASVIAFLKDKKLIS